jgi:quinolinate synthase
MYRRFRDSPSRTFIIASEIGMVDRLRREIPGKTFIPYMAGIECPTMKRITLQNTYDALRDETPVVRVQEGIRVLALKPIERMLEMSS